MKEFLSKLGFNDENFDFKDKKCQELLFALYLKDELSLDELYLELGLKSEEFLKALAKYYKMEFLDFESFDEKLSLPIALLLEFKILPIKSDDKNIYIARAKPFSLELLERIQGFFRDKFVKGVIGDCFKISKELNRLRIKEELRTLTLKLKEEWSDKLKAQNQSSINQIFNFILKEALDLNSSDIHIEARKDDALIRFRVDGELQFFCILEKEVYQALVFHIKFLTHLNVAEQRKAQDGNFELKLENQNYDFRVSTLPLIYGESVVLRILKHDKNFLELKNLNFLEKDLKALEKAIFSSYGMILITGATGSGKSTTLYACLNALKSIKKKIITAEDPIEYKMQGVQQILLNPKAGLEFNNALRAILRQDPDIIMIGEIRDEQSLDIAVKSALTGHLLLSTLHTNDSISTIDRLLDMKAKPYLIAQALSLVVAQRLVRKLCVFCKVKSKKKHDFEGEFYESKGCEHCNHSGFLGREVVGEFLVIDENLKELIRENAGKKRILEYARKQGFKTMLECGLQKAKDGVTSIEELRRVLE
ncbi:MAG: type II/IV secretion system protein [Campylobacter sp.]|nr:type II/IV secretion system protein [Campylobacter sp.]